MRRPGQTCSSKKRRFESSFMLKKSRGGNVSYRRLSRNTWKAARCDLSYLVGILKVLFLSHVLFCFQMSIIRRVQASILPTETQVGTFIRKGLGRLHSYGRGTEISDSQQPDVFLTPYVCHRLPLMPAATDGGGAIRE